MLKTGKRPGDDDGIFVVGHCGDIAIGGAVVLPLWLKILKEIEPRISRMGTDKREDRGFGFQKSGRILLSVVG